MKAIKLNPRTCIILMALILLITYSIEAQSTYTPIQTGGGYDLTNSIATKDSIVIDGKSFVIYETTRDTKHLKLVGKKGNSYALWLGTKTGDTYQGRDVYQSKKGSYCIYKIGKAGNPFALWLKKSE